MPKAQPTVQLTIGDLPEFEGVIPVGVITKIKGASQRITRAIHHGERGLALIEWENDDIGFPMTKDGMKRRQTLRVLDLYEIGDERGTALLAEVRAEYRKADDGRKGRTPLFEEPPSPGAQVKTDASGVVMTPAEAADDEWEQDRAAFAELEAARRRRAEPDPNAAPFEGIEGFGARQLVTYIKHASDRELVLAIGAWEEARENRTSVVNASTKRAAELS